MTPQFNPMDRARRHPIVCPKPAPDFFEGALLGNGGLGVVVCTRPDAIVLRFGHNNIWDIRVAEENQDKIGTFQEVFERVKAIPSTHQSLGDDPWFRDYLKMARENYAKPYPRPFPCGSLVLGFDRRETEVLGHRLDISNGLCQVHLATHAKPVSLQIFTDMSADRVWLRTVNAKNKPTASPFDRVKLLPDPATPQDMPPFTTPEPMPHDRLSFRQVLPFQEPHQRDATNGHPKDRAFRLTVRVSDGLEVRTRTNTWSGVPEPMGKLERGLVGAPAFVCCAQLDEGLASEIANDSPHPDLSLKGRGERTDAAAKRISSPLGGEDVSPVRDNVPARDKGEGHAPSSSRLASALKRNQESWQQFWSGSGVALDDPILERTWYQNLYFLNCAVKPGVTCPGLFANWSHGKIGTAWHGDYHLDYNVQQPFWVTFSSNHVDKHLPYVDMVDHLLPVCRTWAREYYQLRGAAFPVSAYPVEMHFCPYPLPTWGWQLCVTPWAVQSLWWHYLYTLDEQFLRARAFGPIKEAVLFVVDYMKRPEAHGPQWSDDKYHIYPTVPTELYGLRPGFDKNFDCLVDLTLTRFVFQAYLKACATLGREMDETELIGNVEEILAHFPAYPTGDSSHGKVFVSVPGENSEIVCNVPNTAMTVFPGEEHGLHSPPEQYAIAANSYRNQRNEGGNNLVFQHLQGARLGLLDLDRFKRQIEYCRLPNGTCTDRVLEAGGRYQDNHDFDFMSRMGIWFENFALPVVINECLLQSYNGVLRFFPNWPKDRDAGFHNLRAAGAFLVSAKQARGVTEWIEIVSEAGSPLKMVLPWEKAKVRSNRTGERTCTGPMLEIGTEPREVLALTNA